MFPNSRLYQIGRRVADSNKSTFFSVAKCNSRGFQPIKNQRGSMLVMALFVIIVFGLLAAALSSLVRSSSNNVIYEVYGVRAKQAAQSGVQSLALSALPLNTTPTACNRGISSPASFSQIPGLTGCQYNAACSTTEINFNGSDYLYYRFTSTGFCEIDQRVVSRTISVDAMQEQ